MFRPPRFLSSARGNPESTNASAASTSRATRPGARLIDPIESDDTPPLPANASAASQIEPDDTPSLLAAVSSALKSHIIRPTSRLADTIESDGTPPLPANVSAASTSRVRRPGARLIDTIESDSTSPLPTTASATSTSHIIRPASPILQSIEFDTPSPLPTSRKTRRPLLQLVREANAANPEPVNILPNSAARGLRRLPFPEMAETGRPTAPTTSTSRVTHQAVPPIIQPTRTMPTLNSSALLSRTFRQSAFRPVNSTAATVYTPTPPVSSSILEFICLYSHDLRRKKKRWQDGKLKFHTFNKKYVVYDDGGGFVGDGHWQGDASEFTEGLEMNLDRGMVIVQVLECTGSKEQDLGEVLGKRAREVEERRVNAATKNPASTASSNPAKRSRGIAAVVQAAPAPVVPAAATTAIPLPSNGGAWSKHAVDLLGMTRPM
ncbi:hypothetical protein GGI42DRAFT_85419 [Trichoderma sp. SZMC 28013]